MIISKQRQRQSLRNLLAGHDLGLDPNWLDDDHFTIYDIIIDLRQNHQFDEWRIRAELNRFALSDPGLKTIVEGMLDLEPRAKPPRYLTLEDIGQNLPEITWFWQNWIPRGFLTTIAAEPGVGKTNMALDLSRRVIHRLPAPDANALPLLNGGNVIYIEAENFRSGLYERARAWDIDMSKLFIFPQADDQDPDLLNLADPATQDDLRDMCFDLHPDLVIIDSFSSVQINSENSIEDVREVLRFFGQLATHHNCATVLLHHLRKPQRNDSSYNNVTQHDLRGSSHLAAMSRAIIGMWNTAKSIHAPRRVQVIKSNLGPAPQPLDLTYHTAGATLFDMRFTKLTEPDLPENLTGECAEWLVEVLTSDGPLTYGELKELADEAGFKENILQNARKTLDWKVVDTRGTRRKGNKWAWYSDVEDKDEPTDPDDAQLRTVANTNGYHMVTWPCDTPPPSKIDPPPLSHGHVTMSEGSQLHLFATRVGKLTPKSLFWSKNRNGAAYAHPATTPPALLSRRRPDDPRRSHGRRARLGSRR